MMWKEAGAEERGAASASAPALDPAPVAEAQHAPLFSLTAMPQENAGAEEAGAVSRSVTTVVPILMSPADIEALRAEGRRMRGATTHCTTQLGWS